MLTTIRPTSQRLHRNRKRWPTVLLTLACVTTVLTGMAPSPAAAAGDDVPTGGTAWPEIIDDIDDLFFEFYDDQMPAGIAVSASKDGQLVVSRSYGYANSADDTPLSPDHQSLLGSATKATITGPTTILALQEAGPSATETLLYGPEGLFGGLYDADIAIGSAATGTPLGWYQSITVDHLLNHTAGFSGASEAGAKAQFAPKPGDVLTYEHVHRHFLQTAGLDHPPGSLRNYDNHHFGMLELVIEALTGEDPFAYTADSYLGSWGLHPEIELLNAAHGPLTSATHTYVDDDPEPVPFTDTYDDYLGFHAGGYRSSTRDTVELLTNLADTYTPVQLARMGFARDGIHDTDAWGDDDTGFVSHDGGHHGGITKLRMTVDGINISVQANSSRDGMSTAMNHLAPTVVDLVRNADIPEHYDIWTGCTDPAPSPGYAEVSRHGLLANRYQCFYDQATAAGYQLSWIDASTVGNSTFFNVVFVPDDGVPRRAFHGYSGTDYQELTDQLTNTGWRPARIDSYPTKSGIRYAGYFEKRKGPRFVALHGLTPSEHQAKFDDLIADGYSPTSLSVAPGRGGLRYTAVYEKGIPGSFRVKSSLTPAQYQTLFDSEARRGRVPVYLNGYNIGESDPRLIVVFRSSNLSGVAHHGLTPAGYQAAWDDATGDGLATTAVTAYEQWGEARYAGLWFKK